jgi:hypothetical protein
VRPLGEVLYQRIASWANGLDLADANPTMPGGIVDRAAECWEPLLAIADAAGGDWPHLARDAAVHLVAGGLEETASPGVELLAHIRDAFDGHAVLPTERLLDELHRRPESPWRDVRGKPLDDRGLARRLKPFVIRSRVIRVGTSTPRGYRAEDFAEAWRRYLPQAQQAQHVQQLSTCKHLGVSDVADVALRSTTAVESHGAEPAFNGSSEKPADTADDMPDLPQFLVRRPPACAQCGSDDGQQRQRGNVWLHAECIRFWSSPLHTARMKQHAGANHD